MEQRGQLQRPELFPFEAKLPSHRQRHLCERSRVIVSVGVLCLQSIGERLYGRQVSLLEGPSCLSFPLDQSGVLERRGRVEGKHLQ